MEILDAGASAFGRVSLNLAGDADEAHGGIDYVLCP